MLYILPKKTGKAEIAMPQLCFHCARASAASRRVGVRLDIWRIFVKRGGRFAAPAHDVRATPRQKRMEGKLLASAVPNDDPDRLSGNSP
jgi:hypothetical protein